MFLSCPTMRENSLKAFSNTDKDYKRANIETSVSLKHVLLGKLQLILYTKAEILTDFQTFFVLSNIFLAEKVLVRSQKTYSRK